MRSGEVRTLLLPPDIKLEDNLSSTDLEVINRLKKDRSVAFIGSALLESEDVNILPRNILPGAFEVSIEEISGKKYPVYSRRNGSQEADGKA